MTLEDTAIFITWRLAGSGSGSKMCVADSRIARIIAGVLRHCGKVRGFYRLHAWVIMPNHVHAILQPRIAMPGVTKWLKGRIGLKAKQILGGPDEPFWQEESLDHAVRSTQELANLIAFVENHPVQAGLAEAPEDWRWSSASKSR